MSKRANKRLQQEADQQNAARLKKLGWEEVEGWDDIFFRWRCTTCKTPKPYIDCGMCKRCEQCYECDPDTKAGKQALKNFTDNKTAIIDFDVFGNALD